MKTIKENWKPVTIGGTTGILMGAGAMYAAQKTVDGSMNQSVVTDQQLAVAATNDKLSFSEAFEAARAEVGPGGIFRWHGNIYNTYTAEEWNSMSGHDKELFAQQVSPEIRPYDMGSSLAAKRVVTEEPSGTNHNQEPDSHPHTDTYTYTQTFTHTYTHDDDVKDDDVRVVGFGDVPLPNGQVVTVEELDINGQRVAVIDVDHDGEADLAMMDINHNHQIDEGEVIDLHTGEALPFDNDDAADATPDMLFTNA